MSEYNDVVGQLLDSAILFLKVDGPEKESVISLLESAQKFNKLAKG